MTIKDRLQHRISPLAGFRSKNGKFKTSLKTAAFTLKIRRHLAKLREAKLSIISPSVANGSVFKGFAPPVCAFLCRYKVINSCRGAVLWLYGRPQKERIIYSIREQRGLCTGVNMTIN